MPDGTTLPPPWLRASPDGVTLQLYVQPRASRTEIAGQHGEGDAARLRIRLAAPPVDGAANEALLRYLKAVTGVPLARLHLVRGATARSKDVLLEGATADEVARSLRQATAPRSPAL